MVGRVRPGGVEGEKEVRLVLMSQRNEWDVYLADLSVLLVIVGV